MNNLSQRSLATLYPFHRIATVLSVVVAVALLSACGGGGSASSASSVTSGSANFSKFVALGDEYTSGFADGGVYRSAQLVSFPNLLAKQFALADGGPFSQPLYSVAEKDGTGYLKMRSSPTAYLKTETFSTGSSGFTGGIIGANGSIPLYSKHVGANNNFGVPNLKVADVLTAGYGLSNPTSFNPHFERLLGGSNASDSYSAYAVGASAGATYFSMWLGNRDVLDFSDAGGTGTAMTSVATFTTNFQSMINAITAISPNGILVSIPQFTTYSARFRTFTRASLLAGTSSSSLFISTSSGVRAATDNDLFLLSAQSRYSNIGSSSFGTGQPFPFGLHPNNPLGNADVLDSAEVSAIVTRINDLNAVISAQATAKGLIYIDINEAGKFLDQANGSGFSGAPYTSGTYTTTFQTGGLFSLDGYTLTPIGNAMLANEMIKGINSKHGATLPLLNLATYVTP